MMINLCAFIFGAVTGFIAVIGSVLLIFNQLSWSFGFFKVTLTSFDPLLISFVAIVLVAASVAHFTDIEISRYTYLSLIAGFVVGMMASFRYFR